MHLHDACGENVGTLRAAAFVLLLLVAPVPVGCRGPAPRDIAVDSTEDPEPAVGPGAQPPALPPLALPTIPDGLSARELHERAVVVDLHADTLWQLWQATVPAQEPELPLQASPDQLAAGGVDAQLYPIFVWPDGPSLRDAALQMLEVWRRDLLGGYPQVEPARSAVDVVRLAGEGKRAALLALEGAKAVEGDPDEIEAFVDAGLVYASLTWNETNAFADGLLGEALHGGLSEAGREMVRRLNGRRVIVDVSHASTGTFWDEVTATERPVIASHSDARAVTDHPRNLDDAQLWALAEAGGVAGLNYHARFLGSGEGTATMDDLLAHVAHMRAVMGPGHVALGSDFDGRIIEPEGMSDASDTPRVTDALVRAGYGHEEIAGILGHDFLRLLHEVRHGSTRPPAGYRPATVLSSSGVSGDVGVERALDHDTRTAWTAPAGRDPMGQGVVLRVAGPGVDRISLAADGPRSDSAVTRVRVVARNEAALYEHVAEADVGDGARPTRIALPRSGCLDELVLEVRVAVVDDSGGPAALSEVLVERRDTDCP